MKPVSLWFILAAFVATPAFAAPAYRPAGSVALGAPDRWDYAVFDPVDARLYVAHGDNVAVIDARRGALVGTVAGISGGTHGVAIVHAARQGFTDDGKGGLAIAFDLKTLKVTHTIPADADADAIAYDSQSGHVFVIEGDPGAITVIDAKSAKPVATIKAGEKMEYGVAADGILYVAGEANSDILKIDTRANRVTARWSATGCDSPHGLALDVARGRLFMGCVNALMMVVDTASGKIVARLPIGRGSDAVAYDPSHRRVFSSNGLDGNVTVYQQTSPDAYVALEPVRTKVSGRTMAVDPHSGRLFVVAADTDPSPTPGGRPKPRPGTLAALMFDPVG